MSILTRACIAFLAEQVYSVGMNSEQLLSGAAGPDDSEHIPDPAAKAMSAKGASKGGRARANVLTPEHRKEIARQAVRARWMKAGKLKQLDETPSAEPR